MKRLIYALAALAAFLALFLAGHSLFSPSTEETPVPSLPVATKHPAAPRQSPPGEALVTALPE